MPPSAEVALTSGQIAAQAAADVGRDNQQTISTVMGLFIAAVVVVLAVGALLAYRVLTVPAKPAMVVSTVAATAAVPATDPAMRFAANAGM